MLVDIATFELKQKWDFRTSSSQRVFGAMVETVRELGYRVEVDEPFRLERSPVSDNITLKAEASGEKRMSEHYSWSQGAWGIASMAIGLIILIYSVSADTGTAGLIMLPVGIVLVLIGVAVSVTGLQTRKLFLVVKLDGTARGTGADPTDVIADVRVIAGASPGFQVGGTAIGGNLVCQPYEGALKKDFKRLANSIDSLLLTF
jgi:hypothetical protein